MGIPDGFISTRIPYPHPNVCFMITDKPSDCLFSLAFLALSVLCPPTRLHCPMTLLFVTLCPHLGLGHQTGKVGNGRDENGSRDWMCVLVCPEFLLLCDTLL